MKKRRGKKGLEEEGKEEEKREKGDAQEVWEKGRGRDERVWGEMGAARVAQRHSVYAKALTAHLHFSVMMKNE